MERGIVEPEGVEDLPPMVEVLDKINAQAAKPNRARKWRNEERMALFHTQEVIGSAKARRNRQGLTFEEG